MSDEIEAAGAAGTAGLAAAALERPEPYAHGEGTCLNCGAQLSGRFCAQCGQAAHAHRTLSHVLEEFAHGVMHFDTKAWRTLPMLVVRPGTLAREYIHGRRAHYISPLAMFLFTVFLMFFIFALVGGPNLARVQDGQGRHLGGASDSFATLELKIRDPEARAALEQARRDVEREQASNKNWEETISDAARDGRLNIRTGSDKLDHKIHDKLLNPDLALYKIQQTAYKLSFLLVPISLPFIALLFLFKRGVTLYDHVVFSLYSLSFMSLLFVALSLLAKTGAWSGVVITPLALLAPPVHFFFHLGGTYALSWFSALWRAAALTVLAGISLLIFVLLIVVLGLVG